MNYLKNAGEIVEMSMIRAFAYNTQYGTVSTKIQVEAMYPEVVGTIDVPIETYTVVISMLCYLTGYSVMVCTDGVCNYVVDNPTGEYYDDLANKELTLDKVVAMDDYND